jgi:hypothetical protein
MSLFSAKEQKMNTDELIEKCRLEGHERIKIAKDYVLQHPDHLEPECEFSFLDKMLDAQLRKAIPIIQKAERERIIRDLEAIDRDAYDVKDFTRRVCDLIVEERQFLKGEGDEQSIPQNSSG